jgi:hypothetical protein
MKPREIADQIETNRDLLHGAGDRSRVTQSWDFRSAQDTFWPYADFPRRQWDPATHPYGIAIRTASGLSRPRSIRSWGARVISAAKLLTTSSRRSISHGQAGLS